AEFGRNLEYYTGFVFEVIASALGPKSPVAGGGRYDGLLAQVGASANVPAVGASIHTERLLSALQESETGARHQPLASAISTHEGWVKRAKE
ncbi:MAG: ATP phosphoribosyltransferase regulatory subunit, partial [Hyphomicrobiaceae bacterium]|nr:ATP phosphoribosyltransferase regulatory subunit [Hyphomicrobiaceae bacterium]